MLKLITTLRWVDNDDGKAPSPLATDPWPVRKSLNCNVAFHHLFPQASNFAFGVVSSKTSTTEGKTVSAGRTGSSSGGGGSGVVDGGGGDETAIEAGIGGVGGARTDGEGYGSDVPAGARIVGGLATSWSGPGEEGKRAVFPALGLGVDRPTDLSLIHI